MNHTKIVIDWLQVSCRGVINKSLSYEYQHLNYRTKQFSKVLEVYKFGELFCTMAYEPYSPIIPPDFVLVKFSNKYLYRNINFAEIKDFIDDHTINYVGITRIDLACDFNRFLNNLHPENLIRKFMTCEYTRVGKGKYKAIGWQGQRQHFEYLRFGSSTSTISAYLYNKTKEFQERKYKPYIEDLWKQSNIDINKDVWRLEMSIKGSRLKFFDSETGELLPLGLGNIFEQDYLLSVYKTLTDRIFHFKINGKSKIKSRLKSVQLFDFKDNSIKGIILQNVDESSRMQKIFIKMLESYNCDIRQQKINIKEFSNDDIINYCKKYNLVDYYYKKVKKD